MYVSKSKRIKNKRAKKQKFEKKIDEMIKKVENKSLIELSYTIGNKKQIIIKNLIAGISRGVGISIGITIITAIIVLLLQRIVELNIPIIGKYLADIVDIVEKSR